MVGKRICFIFSACLVLFAMGQQVEFRDLPGLRKRLGLQAYDELPTLKDKLKKIKVAIIDNGFGDLQTIEEDLPKGLFTLVDTYDKDFIERHKLGSVDLQKPLDDKDDHGRTMARLVWAATGYKADSAPHFYLLNGNGLTNFSRAVHFAVEKKVDIILYSHNWEYGGNFDGRGFINRIVDHATQNQILWVNAAGNYAGRVYNGTVTLDEEGWVKFRRHSNANGETTEDIALRFRCRLDRTPVRIVLSWNRYSEKEEIGTDRDLDLYVYNDKNELVHQSELKQIVAREGVARQEQESYVPREIIEKNFQRNKNGADGKPTYYTLRVFVKSGKFNETDRLRITIYSKKSAYYDAEEKRTVDPVEFADATKGQEVMIPADHPEVITVGDLSPISASGPTADGRSKPDVILEKSEAEFTDGEGSAGTSNGAAYFAGVLAVLKAHDPTLTREKVLRFAQKTKRSQTRRPGERLGIEDLGVEKVRQIHGPVFDAIESILGGRGAGQASPIVLAGKYRNGSYIVALDRSPLELSAWYTTLPRRHRNPEHYEIYLTAEKNRDGFDVYAYARDKARSQTAQEQDWEVKLRENPETFVQVVKAKRIGIDIPSEPDGEIEIPLWKTPSPADLKKTR